MATDRTYRMLTGLNGASTARVLNLITVERMHGAEPEYTAFPLFKSPVLNTSIILKHRLRSDEIYLFPRSLSVATKIIVPFAKSDLRVGGRSVFVDQKGFEDAIADLGQYADDGGRERDIAVLRHLDTLPSLDPFILREFLASLNIRVSDLYFNISQSDQLRMREYVAAQVRKLSSLASAGSELQDEVSNVRLAATLLSSNMDARLEPLRIALDLQGDAFRQGVFAWRGFLYYKWKVEELWPEMTTVAVQIGQVRATGRMDSDMRTYIAASKEKLSRSIFKVMEEVVRTTTHYDKAYEGLIGGTDPKVFCDFLLEAPALFRKLGEQMGAIEHIASYWKYRFPDDRRLECDGTELESIFQDFESGVPQD